VHAANGSGMPDYTLLLIDYEPRSIGRLRRPLEEAGYRVEVARDGIAGAKRFDELRPDLTLIEAMLPKKHGFDLCRELKDRPHGQRTPVLLITAVYKGRKYRYDAKHHYHCDAYLEKPIDDERLVELVREFLEQGVRAAQPKAAPSVEASLPPGSDADDTLQHLDAVLQGAAPSEAQQQQQAGRTTGVAEPLVGAAESNVLAFDPERPRQPPPAAAVGGRRGGPETAALHETELSPTAVPVSPPVSAPRPPRRAAVRPATVRQRSVRGRVLLWIAFALLAATGATMAFLLL